MMLFTMALRNLRRNGRRTFLAGLSVFMAVFLIQVLGGLIGGFLDSLVRNYTKNESGHILISTEGYFARQSFMPPDESLADAQALRAAILSDPVLAAGTAILAERARFGVLLSTDGGSKPAIGVAGDPDTEKSMLMLDRSLIRGTYCDSRGSVILGWKLAAALKLDVGDKLRVLTKKADSGIGFKKFTISGIFSTGVNTLDDGIFQLGILDARELLGTSGGQQLVIMLRDYKNSQEYSARIEAVLENKGFTGLKVTPWTKNGDFPKLIRMMESVDIWMFVVVAFLGAFIITNIMMMVTLERKHETGILKSMGMGNTNITLLFLIEGMLLGSGGAFCGAFAGLGFNALLSRTGFDMTSAMSSFAWPMDNIVYPTVSIPDTFLYALLGTAVSAIMSWAPSRRAARMNAVEAMRSI